MRRSATGAGEITRLYRFPLACEVEFGLIKPSITAADSANHLREEAPDLVAQARDRWRLPADHHPRPPRPDVLEAPSPADDYNARHHLRHRRRDPNVRLKTTSNSQPRWATPSSVLSPAAVSKDAETPETDTVPWPNMAGLSSADQQVAHSPAPLETSRRRDQGCVVSRGRLPAVAPMAIAAARAILDR
jgi:hypothetical protein